MNANKVEKKISEITFFQNTAKRILRKKISDLQKEFDEISRNGNRYKQGLLKTLKKKIDSYFNDDNTCDCQYRYPDRIELRTDGVFCIF